ncbi:carboxypeptidase-like regulatory domain-containing protein [Olivibacter sitiensis]|uniref:carboxypeptidase-like regulatory domain-containing protein n=1 Tax=Olivibacter sitiensis TaxID=376470 RepID=UPI000403EE50|nr:carboxypeptidase-like regulatory domain-containing protein [Olivibacter sitiensis]
MLLRHHILYLLILISPSTALAQLVLVKGNVSDKKTNSKLSGVTVKVGAQATATNKDGYFELTAPLKTITESGINFSHLGYLNSRLIYQPNHFYEVELMESGTELGEVVITARVNGEDIIKKAIKKIPENYPDKPISINGVLRIQTWRNQSEYFKSDALIQAYIPAYTSKEKTTVTVLQNRLDTLYDPSLRYLRRMAHYNVVEFQDIAHNSYILNKISKKKKFDYVMTGIQTYNGHRVFVINTTVRDTGKVYDRIEASLYIDTASYAFVAANIYFYNLVRMGLLTNEILNHRVDYEKIGKKWYLKEAHAYTELELKEQKPIAYVNFIRTEIDSIHPQPIPYKDIVQNGDNMLSIDKPGSEEEWARHEHLFKKAEDEGKMELISAALLDTIRQNNAINQSLKRPFMNRVYSYLSNGNVKSSLGLAKFPIAISSEFHSVPGMVGYGLRLGTDYRLYKKLFVGFELGSNIWNKRRIGVSTLALNLSNDFVFNKDGRHIILSPYVGFGRISTRFEGERANYTAFDYGLRASYELSRKRALFISSGFNSANGSSTLNTVTITPTRYALGFGLVFRL